MMPFKSILLLIALGGSLLARAAESAPAAKPAFDRAQAGRIAMVVGRILEGIHYKQTPFNDAISETFLQNYLDAFDYNHLVFLQTDVDDFKKRYSTTLDDATRRTDTRPAFEIYELYLKRLHERNELVHKILKEELDFNGSETILRQRNKAPWPATAAEAESLWRARIKYELLQDKIAKDAQAKTNSPAASDPSGAANTSAAASSDPVKTIQRRYDRLLRDMKDLDEEDIVQIYLSALARAYDPHTEYFGPREAKDFDINHIKLSLSGIGARLRWEDGYTRVESLVPGGPADLSKQIKPNDRVVAVAQASGEPVDVVDMKLRKVVELIRGPRGTDVHLTIVPANAAESERKVITITRDEIKLKEQLAKAKIVDLPDPLATTRRLGVISLPQFYDNCARDVEKLLGRLQEEKVSGIVLDLRRNGGGLLEEAIALTGLFIREGPVVQVRDNRRETQVYEDTDPKLVYTGPLVVLVSRLSASASEIIAAALQDYGRAIVVGDQSTHGKGTVQSLLSLSQFIRGDLVQDPGKLKLTVSKFYRVAGGTTQKNGLTPDIVLPSLYDHMEIGEAHLPNSLPADQIDPAQFDRLNLAGSLLPELSKRSAARIDQDQDFAYLREDIQRLRRQREEKTISVNLPALTREREELDAREKRRKDERASRKPDNTSVFAINLDMVDERKPLEALTRLKPNLENQLASATTAPANAVVAAEPVDDPDDPDQSNSGNPTLDPHLTETLHILQDFINLCADHPGAKLTAQPSPVPVPGAR